jgi:protease I
MIEGKQILYLIAQQNFRDEEYFIPKEIFEQRGAKVITASLEKEEARGMLGAKVMPDIAIREANPNEFDALVIAGGTGSPRLANYPEVLRIVKDFNEKRKVIGAICVAGYILARAGVLEGREATIYPADFALAEYRKQGVKYLEKPIVRDGNVITADGPKVAKEFGEEIVRALSKI